MGNRAAGWWRSPVVLTIGLVIVADALFHGAGLGFNTAMLLGLASAVLVLRFRRLHSIGGLLALATALLVAFGLALEATPLALTLGALALLALVVIGRSGAPADAVEALAMAASLRVPILRDLRAVMRRRRARGRRPGYTRPISRVVQWGPGLATATVFAVLFLFAGPVFAAQWHQLTDWIELPPLRVASWAGWAAGAWILLRGRPTTAWREWARQRMRTFELTLPWSASVSRALLLCNAVFVLQSAGDVGHVFVRAPLPLWMTLSSNAQRGAHVLIVATLLSAAIVLLSAARGGPWHDNPTARGFVESWLVQDAILVAGAFLRLHLYVSTYALTRLRAAAFAWVALVAIGLLLVLLRLVLRREGRWLVTACALATGCLLVTMSLADIDGRIARFNVDHCSEATGEGTKLDIGYLLHLGPESMPALLLHGRRAADRDAAFPALQSIVRLRQQLYRSLGGWRGASLRRLALRRWLEEHPTFDQWRPTP